MMRGFRWLILMAVLLASLVCSAQDRSASVALGLDRDLVDIDIARLQALYLSNKYTVTQVTQWYLDRIARYDGVYKSMIRVDSASALATAAAQDAEKKKAGTSFKPGLLWGVPIVVKANTSIEGKVTSTGWAGYLVKGHELVAPKDARVIAKLKAAGVVILGHTNMPDFAGGETTISSAGGRTGNAYNWRFSPGGSSGGTATAVSANFAVWGTGTDTSDSIRLPAGSSGLVGVLPTRGLVSIDGIHPYDWLLDDTGPLSRNVTDAAIALSVMAGEDPKDRRTVGSSAKAQPGPYTRYLKPDALKGKRFGVPAFISADSRFDGIGLRPETNEAFMKAIDRLRTAGATVVIDPTLLPNSFMGLIGDINSQPYMREGVENFLRDYGPSEYHSTADYSRVVGMPFPGFFFSAGTAAFQPDPRAESNFWGPQRRALAAYEEGMTRNRLDGFVYPALQMPPDDESNGRIFQGAKTRTGWTNPIGVPAVVVPAGFYENGLPFGLEFSARQWKDGDLLGWAYAYEQATHSRKPPTLVDRAP
jgi:amidase